METNHFVLSVVIPCYNERETIQRVIDAVAASGVERQEIIIVDDYSTDGCREWLQSCTDERVSRILYHEVNKGKGAALRTGFQAATGDIVIVQDADMEYDPKDYAAVAAPIVGGEADVCYGSRFAAGQDYPGAYKANILANKGLTLLSNICSGLRITDMETCYKAFRREIIQAVEIEENRFGFEPEITAKIAKMGVRVTEVPIAYYPRSKAEGKKIGWKDGVRALWCIAKYNLFTGKKDA